MCVIEGPAKKNTKRMHIYIFYKYFKCVKILYFIKKYFFIN